jgi:WD40 repeat protein
MSLEIEQARAFYYGIGMQPFKKAFLRRRLNFSPDSRYLVITGRQSEETIFAWRLEDGKVLRPSLYGSSFLDFIGDSHRLMGDGADIWDLDANHLQKTAGNFRSEEPGVKPFIDTYFDQCMTLNQAGTLLLGSPLHTPDFRFSRLGLWEVASGKLLERFNTPEVYQNNAKVRFGPDSSYFILAAQLKPEDTFLTVSSWKIADGQKLFEEKIEANSAGRDLNRFNYSLSMDGTHLSVNRTRFEVGANSLSPVEKVAEESAIPPFTTGKISPDNRYLIRSVVGDKVEVWDVATQQLTASLDTNYRDSEGKTKKLEIRVVGASRDSQYIAAADDTVALVWKLK